MRTVALDQANPSIAELVYELETSGEDMLITDGGRPRARLVHANAAAEESSRAAEQAGAGRQWLAYRDRSRGADAADWPSWDQIKTMMRDEDD